MGAKKIELNSDFNMSELFTDYWSFFSVASRDPSYFYKNLSTVDFIKFVSMRGLRSRGIDIERRIQLKNNWKRLPRNIEAGDLIDHNGKHVEVKSSIVTPNKDSNITLRGFRKWEKGIDYYLAVVINIQNFSNPPELYIFKFYPEYIDEEPRFKPYSQSKKSRDGSNITLGINLKICDSLFENWKSMYEVQNIQF